MVQHRAPLDGAEQQDGRGQPSEVSRCRSGLPWWPSTGRRDATVGGSGHSDPLSVVSAEGLLTPSPRAPSPRPGAARRVRAPVPQELDRRLQGRVGVAHASADREVHGQLGGEAGQGQAGGQHPHAVLPEQPRDRLAELGVRDRHLPAELFVSHRPVLPAAAARGSPASFGDRVQKTRPKIAVPDPAFMRVSGVRLGVQETSGYCCENEGRKSGPNFLPTMVRARARRICWRIRRSRTFAGKSARIMAPNWTKIGLLP